MALIVETGSGRADADAFVTVAFVDAYFDARGTATWTGDTTPKEQAIKRATAFLSNAFNWQGVRTQGRNQALSWPRSGVQDRDGDDVQPDEIPIELQQATAEVALRELITPGSMTPDYTPSKRIAKVSLGPMDVTYDMSQTDASAVRIIMHVVADLVGQFTGSSGSTSLTGVVER